MIRLIKKDPSEEHREYLEDINLSGRIVAFRTVSFIYVLKRLYLPINDEPRSYDWLFYPINSVNITNYKYYSKEAKESINQAIKDGYRVYVYDNWHEFFSWLVVEPSEQGK